MEYQFTLKFKLPPEGGDADVLLERLGQCGCDDALVGVGQPGRIGLEFARDAESASVAITTAIRDVKRAIPDANLIEVSPDFVGLTDVADLLGMTRQNMRKLMLAHVQSFPAPVHEGSSGIWHLAPVLQWFLERGTYQIERTVMDVALTAMQVNQTKEAEQLPPHVHAELRALVA